MSLSLPKGPGFIQTALPGNRQYRKITATSLENYTNLTNELSKNVNHNKAMMIGQHILNPASTKDKISAFQTEHTSRMHNYELQRGFTQDSARGPNKLRSKFDQILSHRKHNQLKPLNQTQMVWNSNMDHRSGSKVPATVRASDMSVYQQRCGTALINKNPLEFEKRIMNQSLDFNNGGPSAGRENSFNQGLLLNIEDQVYHDTRNSPRHYTQTNRNTGRSEDKDIGAKIFYKTHSNNLRMSTDDSPRVNQSLQESPFGKKAHQDSIGYHAPVDPKYTMTVREMALNGIRVLPQEYAPDMGLRGEFKVASHLVNPDLRFNFPNKGYRVPQAKMRRYMDTHMQNQVKMPSPDKYDLDLEFLDPTKKHKIYPSERKTWIMNTIDTGKKLPGVAAYDITKFDEKFVKQKVNTLINLKEERYTNIDEIKFLQKQLPSFHNVIPIETTKRKAINFKIRQETEKEQEVTRRSTEKNNSPSPVTYKTAEVFEKALFNKKNAKHTIGKSKPKHFIDLVQERAKKIPGPEKYNAHLCLDKVVRPMKKF